MQKPKPKKVPAPKGAELKLEKPVDIKVAQIKRDFNQARTGGLDKKTPNARGIINEIKVANAFKVGKKNK